MAGKRAPPQHREGWAKVRKGPAKLVQIAFADARLFWHLSAQKVFSALVLFRSVFFALTEFIQRFFPI